MSTYTCVLERVGFLWSDSLAVRSGAAERFDLVSAAPPLRVIVDPRTYSPRRRFASLMIRATILHNMHRLILKAGADRPAFRNLTVSGVCLWFIMYVALRFRAWQRVLRLKQALTAVLSRVAACSLAKEAGFDRRVLGIPCDFNWCKHVLVVMLWALWARVLFAVSQFLVRSRRSGLAVRA